MVLGTPKLLARYGEQLVCVRYRYDAARKVRHKTVELIIETVPWVPNRRNPRREPEDMGGGENRVLRDRIAGADQGRRCHLAAEAQAVGGGLADGEGARVAGSRSRSGPALNPIYI